MKTRLALALVSSVLLFNAGSVQAAVSFATPEQDRTAKAAVAPSGKVLLYVYRLADANPQAAPNLWINGQVTGPLPQNSFRLWAALPGRVEIHTGRVEEQSIDTMLLGIHVDAGKTYYVRLTVNAQGGMSLRETPAQTARAEMRNARYILGTGEMTYQAPAETPAAAAPEPLVNKLSTARSHEYGVTLTFKVGTLLSLSQNQTIASAGRNLSSNSFIYGLQGEWREERGFAVGLEWLAHTNDYTSNASPASGDADFSYIFFNIKQYFKTGTLAQPYIGAGYGRTTASFSANTGGGVNGSVDSNALQAMAGVTFRWPHVDLYTEYKYLHDQFTLGGNVNASGNGFFVGVSSHF